MHGNMSGGQAQFSGSDSATRFAHGRRFVQGRGKEAPGELTVLGSDSASVSITIRRPSDAFACNERAAACSSNIPTLLHQAARMGLVADMSTGAQSHPELCTSAHNSLDFESTQK